MALVQVLEQHSKVLELALVHSKALELVHSKVLELGSMLALEHSKLLSSQRAWREAWQAIRHRHRMMVVLVRSMALVQVLGSTLALELHNRNPCPST